MEIAPYIRDRFYIDYSVILGQRYANEERLLSGREKMALRSKYSDLPGIVSFSIMIISLLFHS